MLQCWELEPDLRPSFSNLVESVSNILENMAGYMDIGAFTKSKASDTAADFKDTNLTPENNTPVACTETNV